MEKENRRPPRFPMFLDLSGQPCVVVGGGPVGLRRANTLRTCGAQVTLIDPAPVPVPEGVKLICRSYRPGDLEGAVLASACTGSRQVNRQVGLDAKALGIPVSVADCQEECTFFFPALCLGEGLVAGVVSDGRRHRDTAQAARAIRQCLEEIK